MDASVQTEHYDITSELRQQIQNLTEVVKQLSALKCIHQHEPKTPASPLFDDQLLDTLLDLALSAVIRSFCNSTPVDPSQQAATAVPVESQPPLQPLLGQNHGEELLPVYPPQVLPPRQPLLAVDQNIILPSSTHSHGPTDEQNKKVAEIVDLGKDMSTAALTCVNILFSDDEMAKCNTSGTKGFQQLDSSKLCFLLSVLKASSTHHVLVSSGIKLLRTLTLNAEERGELLSIG